MNPLHLILNGKSAARQDVRAAVAAARSAGIPINVQVTWEAGDAHRYACTGAVAAARAGDGTVIVAGGGDGTVNEVLNGLLASGQRVPMAVMPLGTANDFATSASVPTTNLLDSLQLAAQVTAVPIDVGVANGQHFLNVASGGFGAEMTERTPVQMKNLLGGGAYALTAAVMAVTGHPYRGRLVTPEHVYEGAMTLMAIGNGRQAGGGALLTPHACLDDGLLDVMVVPDHAQNRIGHLIADLLQLKHGESEHFHYLRAPRLRVESEDPLQFNLDGEPLRAHAFDFSLLPRAIDFVLPPNSPLLTRLPLSTPTPTAA